MHIQWLVHKKKYKIYSNIKLKEEKSSDFKFYNNSKTVNFSWLFRKMNHIKKEELV